MSFLQEVGWLVISSKEVFSVITHLCLVAEGARQVYTGLKGRFFRVTFSPAKFDLSRSQACPVRTYLTFSKPSTPGHFSRQRLAG